MGSRLAYALRWPRKLQQRYCVYAFINPCSDEVFYVGKGNLYRLAAHTSEVNWGCPCLKCHTIRDIWDNELQVQVNILFETDVERDAYVYEWAMINMVFVSLSLTNVKDSVIGRERDRRKRAADTIRLFDPNVRQRVLDYAMSKIEIRPE